jgi:phosphoadenosine phosphosulfate reductase
VSVLAPHIASERDLLPPADALDRALREASPQDVIAAALEIVGREKLALVSSFGTQSAALLKAMADVDPAIPVIFLDTGWLFEETLAYRDTLIAKLDLRDVRAIKPQRALKPFDGWINGRKRFQGGLRSDIAVVERDGARLKFNPFANVSREQIEVIFKSANLPPHPLAASGYLSVGCMPCTSRTSPDEDERAGRWRGRPKTECGIHTMQSA